MKENEKNYITVNFDHFEGIKGAKGDSPGKLFFCIRNFFIYSVVIFYVYKCGLTLSFADI